MESFRWCGVERVLARYPKEKVVQKPGALRREKRSGRKYRCETVHEMSMIWVRNLNF
jgi:hypothetical protein